ncbi:MAG: LysM peptidoglycan-binding domain-containing protein [Candidatus Moranbacteria bacterium]|nr:LysM peptidoglycan-binding domain-containing protein [Candidatus Moranbacteria bacterium]
MAVVVSSAFLVSATNLAAGHESSGFLFGYLGSSADNFDNPLANKIIIDKETNLNLIAFSQASLSPDPNAVLEEGIDETMIVQGEALVAGMSPVRRDPEEEGGVTKYIVQSGDTVSGIASKFKITTNTILWANELDNVDSIKPGDEIFILPVAGLSYTVKKGEKLEDIAEKYKANLQGIIAYNELPANGEINEGEIIIIPGGQKELPAVESPRSQIASGISQRAYEPFSATGRILSGKAGTGHRFPYGYCTWYVSQKRYIPWGGNAGTWIYNAKAMGYATGRTPRPGAIMVSSESWWGHVAIVESVSSGQITVSEMNYAGWGRKSTRTLASNSRVIKGFIY